MTWLITGGTGQLGIAVSKELTKRDLSFISCGSKDLDITRGAILSDFIGQLSPEVIINCAAWTDVDGAESHEELAAGINTQGAENLTKAAKACGARLVHISTDYVFFGVNQEPWEVDALRAPQSAYGRTKADGENRILNLYPEGSIIIRTAWLYSPWGKNFAKTMTKLALRSDGEVRVVNDQIGQPTSASDLAQQIATLVLSEPLNGIFHGTNSGEATWFEFAQEIFTCVGADLSRLIPVSSNQYPQKAIRPTNSVLSHKDWEKTSITPMRDWRHALTDAMPEIISSVQSLG